MTMHGYPPCANPECDYELCFMERRDLDECPACGHPIPVELQLDNNFNQVHTPIHPPRTEN